MNIRKPVFAGSWYPGDAKGCARDIDRFVGEYPLVDPGFTPIGGIVPHAGWFFSGAVAANVIRTIAQGGDVDTVVLFGMHLHANSPSYITCEGGFETPLGILPVDEELASALMENHSFLVEDHINFTEDNTIELQLPFIRHFFGNVSVVAMGVPPSDSAIEIGSLVADLSGKMGRRISVIGSTDLTHYGPNYGMTAQGIGDVAQSWVRKENDRRVIDAMMALNPAAVIREGQTRRNACCAGAAAAALKTATCLGAESASLLAHTLSSDKAPGDSFVGYAGVVFG